MKDNLIFTNGSELELGTIYCIGKNYSKHAKEMGSEVPEQPVIFIKPPAAYTQSGDTVILPDISEMVHYEVELVVVISKDGVNIKKEDARDYIAGYGVGIDVTLRDIQNKAKKKGEPWAVAKGFFTSAPISQIVPTNKIDNNFFSLELKVNGEIKQTGNTKDMENSVEELIEYISKVFTVRQGDVIFTGTPEGVGQIKSGDKLYAELKGYVSLEVSVE